MLHTFSWNNLWLIHKWKNVNDHDNVLLMAFKEKKWYLSFFNVPKWEIALTTTINFKCNCAGVRIRSHIGEIWGSTYSLFGTQFLKQRRFLRRWFSNHLEYMYALRVCCVCCQLLHLNANTADRSSAWKTAPSLWPLKKNEPFGK